MAGIRFRNGLAGNGGDDEIHAEDHGDWMWGDDGDDVLYGEDGYDWIGGGPGIDLCFTGEDVIC